jgi:hypothetical protein
MSNLAEATAKVVDVLTTFNSEERLRIVRASLTLLGDDFNPPVTPSRGSKGPEQGGNNGDDEASEVHSLAQQWMKRNGVTLDQLEHCFHFDQGQVIPIALPGNATSKREQTANAYLAVGLAHYLANGDASFSDADARKLCEQSGCYDNANHTKSVKALKNRVTGSKSAGWKLTAPGLSAAAELVKQPKT